MTILREWYVSFSVLVNGIKNVRAILKFNRESGNQAGLTIQDRTFFHVIVNIKTYLQKKKKMFY